MQSDFHYYAAYCAAILAGYSHEQSLDIATADEYTDWCTRTALKRMKAPLAAATTQTQMEMMDLTPGLLTVQDITRIWSSFHFLPGDLHAVPAGRRVTKRYLNRYRLICKPNGALLTETVRLAGRDGSLQAAGIAMHILCDTWAHQNFVGTPSYVINSACGDFTEFVAESGAETERPVVFRHKVGGKDDLENGKYTASIAQYNERSVMNLGHGRVGHLPDYSFMKYRYLPAWGDYEEIVKDNPSDYMHAFTQMVYALRLLKDGKDTFTPDTYDTETVAPYRDTVEKILRKRQHKASADWKTFGEQLSGQPVPDFSAWQFEQEYISTAKEDKDATRPGRYILAALNQKSMVTKQIYDSGNMLAGFSVTYDGKRGKGIRDFRKLIGLAGSGEEATDK